ncbi:MAG: VOC family protein [Deltaproteobacteria bacterium]|nr:VOC family protein [Deltaproteobacteria bacterium]
MEPERQHPSRDRIDHLAVVVSNIPRAVAWYTTRFNCTVAYQDETWALLEFANTQLALVTPGQHPAHFALVTPDAARLGPLQRHRDGTQSIYIGDPFGNAIELIGPVSEETT